MRPESSRTALALGAVALLLAGLGPAVAADGGHPDVETAATCDDCHREATPTIVIEWYAGAHGRNSVKCFVCHGTTGEGFMRVPSAVRCIGCHAEQVPADVQGKDAGCFSCHPPHRLSPHVASAPAIKGGQS